MKEYKKAKVDEWRWNVLRKGGAPQVLEKVGRNMECIDCMNSKFLAALSVRRSHDKAGIRTKNLLEGSPLWGRTECLAGYASCGV